MNYLDELFNRYAELWTVHGDCKKREPFKIAISEALEKQRKLSCIAINNEGWHTYSECRTLILETKLEEL